MLTKYKIVNATVWGTRGGGVIFFFFFTKKIQRKHKKLQAMMSWYYNNSNHNHICRWLRKYVYYLKSLEKLIHHEYIIIVDLAYLLESLFLYKNRCYRHLGSWTYNFIISNMDMQEVYTQIILNYTQIFIKIEHRGIFSHITCVKNNVAEHRIFF